MKVHPGGSCNGLFNHGSQRDPKQGSAASLMIASRILPKFFDGRLGFGALISCESRKKVYCIFLCIKVCSEDLYLYTCWAKRIVTRVRTRATTFNITITFNIDNTFANN